VPHQKRLCELCQRDDKGTRANPFNPETTIKYHVLRSQNINISVYNLIGQKVITLVNENKTPGHYKTIWDGKNSMGRQVSSGNYIYEIKTGTFIQSRKMTLLR